MTLSREREASLAPLQNKHVCFRFGLFILGFGVFLYSGHAFCRFEYIFFLLYLEDTLIGPYSYNLFHKNVCVYLGTNLYTNLYSCSLFSMVKHLRLMNFTCIGSVMFITSMIFSQGDVICYYIKSMHTHA